MVPEKKLTREELLELAQLSEEAGGELSVVIAKIHDDFVARLDNERLASTCVFNAAIEMLAMTIAGCVATEKGISLGDVMDRDMDVIRRQAHQMAMQILSSHTGSGIVLKFDGEKPPEIL